MLELDEGLRRRLLARRALIVDEDGDEVFAGLTVSESVFYNRPVGQAVRQRPRHAYSLRELQVSDEIWCGLLSIKHKNVAIRSADLCKMLLCFTKTTKSA